MNKLSIIGRLTRDPEVRWTAANPSTCIAKFGIAADRKVKSENGPQADFFNCVAFGKMAEHLEKYWRKGMKIAITGRLESSQYTDKAGNKRTDIQIVVEETDFCEKKQEAPEKPMGFTPDEDDVIPFKF